MPDSRYIIGRMHCVNGSFSLHHTGIVGFFLWRFFFSPTFQDHVDILFVFFSFEVHGSVQQVAWAATYCCSTQLDHDFVNASAVDDAQMLLNAKFVYSIFAWIFFVVACNFFA